MSQIRYILLFFIVISLLVGCGGAVKSDTELDRAESFVDTCPDSAIAILQAYPTDSTVPAALRARHALLLSKAYDKGFIDLTDDSLINIAFRYYSIEDNDRCGLMMSLYYRGRVYRNAGNTGLAVENFLKSQIIAEELGDNFILGMICRNLSTMYGDVYCGEEEIDYGRKSLGYLIAHGDPLYIAEGKLVLSRVLLNNGHAAESLDLSKEVLEYADLTEDDDLREYALRARGGALLLSDDMYGALEAFRSISAMPDPRLTASDQSNMVFIYDRIGDYASRDSLLDMIHRRSSVVQLSHEYYSRSGDWEKAYRSLVVYADSMDHIMWTINRSNLTRTANMIQEQEIELRKSKIQYLNLKNGVIIGVCLILILIFIYVDRLHRLRLRSLNAELEARLSDATLLSRDLHNLRTHFDNARQSYKDDGEKIRKMLMLRFKDLDSICEGYYEANDVKDKKKIIRHIENVIDDISSSGQSIGYIREIVDVCWDNVISRLKEYKSLSEDDILLATYLLAGFSQRSVCVLTKEKIEVIYNRKSRLKSKIRKLDIEDRDEIVAGLG